MSAGENPITAPVRCIEDGCTAAHPNHRWGKIAAFEAGWFSERNGERRSWCPEHVPEQIREWRARRAAATN